jgi:hypothetical protein
MQVKGQKCLSSQATLKIKKQSIYHCTSPIQPLSKDIIDRGYK